MEWSKMARTCSSLLAFPVTKVTGRRRTTGDDVISRRQTSQALEEKNSNTSLDQPLSVDSTGVFLLLLILLYEGLSLTLVWLSGYFVAYLYI